MSVSFTLLIEGKTELSIYNAQGQKVAQIFEQNMPAGQYVYSVKTSLANGFYYTTINNNGNFATSKIIITK
jgi:hypothetical protein